MKPRRSYPRLAAWALAVAVGVSGVSALVYAHGGKGHGAGEFTHLEALKKATEIYDKLIESNKLDASWETDLERVTIAERRKDDATETVVTFQRKKGEPRSVFIFFTDQGRYAGSNFTGK